MSYTDIIERISKGKIVEQIVANINKKAINDDDFTTDLVQDIYLELLTKSPQLIEKMYNNNQLHYFITRMVLNSIKSKNSRYYYNYIRWNRNRETYEPQE